MGGVLPAGRAIFAQIELSLDLLLVLAGIIINAAAGGALHPGQILRKFGLSHARLNVIGFGLFCNTRAKPPTTNAYFNS